MSSTVAIATSAATRMSRARPARPSVLRPGPPSFSAAKVSTRRMCHAGTSPNSTVAASEISRRDEDGGDIDA